MKKKHISKRLKGGSSDIAFTFSLPVHLFTLKCQFDVKNFSFHCCCLRIVQNIQQLNIDLSVIRFIRFDQSVNNFSQMIFNFVENIGKYLNNLK